MSPEAGGSAISEKKHTHIFRSVFVFCIVIYLAAVLWYTIGRRSAGYYPPQYSLFGSYKLWFNGDAETGYEIIANIAMFVPFGFFASAIGKQPPRKVFPAVLLLALAFSFLIETAQWFLMRGYFVYDDIFNNVSGAVLGALFFRLMKRFLPEKSLQAVQYVIHAGILIFCLGLFFFTASAGEDIMAPVSQGLCFQVEEASVQEGGINLSGVCFWYDREPLACTILLRSTQTEETHSLQTESCLPRPDVSAYFHREGLKAGFQATGRSIAENEEYEIILDFKFFRTIPTGVFLTVRRDSDLKQAMVDIHYTPSGELIPLETAGTDLEEIASKSVLQAYWPNWHVYLYSCEESLYWIAEEGFHFERDGTTYMSVLLWTTEPEKISEASKARGLSYDALGTDFEWSQLPGNFGRYRVCTWKLPSDYPITSITAGYYRRGWVWKKSFWPVFDFSSGETLAGL